MTTVNKFELAPFEETELPSFEEFLATDEQTDIGALLDASREALLLSLERKTKVPVRNVHDQILELEVTREGLGPIQPKYGDFWLGDYKLNDKWGAYQAIITCPDMDINTGTPVFRNREELLVRIDSGCATGQVFHDETCDCADQLIHAMKELTSVGEGVIIHIPGQDGRGMGKAFKLGTLHIQKQTGANTVQAATVLRFTRDIHQSIMELNDLGEYGLMRDVVQKMNDLKTHGSIGRVDVLEDVRAEILAVVEKTRERLKVSSIDQRTYEGVIAVLQTLGIQPGTRIHLATNNPHKMEVFTRNGYKVTGKPVITESAKKIADHLAAKATYLRHVIPTDVTDGNAITEATE